MEEKMDMMPQKPEESDISIHHMGLRSDVALTVHSRNIVGGVECSSDSHISSCSIFFKAVEFT